MACGVRTTERNRDMKEVWKDIKGWEDRYQVSDHGRVRSKDVHQVDRLGRSWRKKGTIHGVHKKPNGYEAARKKAHSAQPGQVKQSTP